MSAPTEPVTPPVPAAPVSPQGPAGSAPAPKPKRKAALGTWAMVLGIIGIVFALIPATSGFGIFLGAVALLLGGIGLLRKGGRALPGSIIAVVALILGIIIAASHSGNASTAPASDASAVTKSSTAPAAAPAKAKTAAPAKKAAPVKKPAAPAGTAAELQALASAKLYLSDGQGFSQAGLLEQLTSTAGSGFTQADAQWAIAHSGADWNAQALSAAKTYLSDGQGFSQASLTSQLTSAAGNKFTAAQAQYAIAHAGADWNAQAVDAAKGYMATGMGFSRQSLIQQLTAAAGNQFTPAQASYAADQVGLK